MPEPVDHILLRFPGPVTFSASRAKWIFLLFGSLTMLVCAAVWVPFRPMPIVISAASRWFLILSAGVAALASIVGLLSNASKLTLGIKGFEFGLPYLPVSIAWADAVNFRAVRKGGHTIFGLSFGGVKIVGFDRASQNSGTWEPPSIWMSGCDGALFDTYGFPAEDLARLMNQWREKALR